jgi:DNA-binding MarR family transcriptional regulator
MDQDINTSREKSHREVGWRLKEAVRANQSANDQFDEALTDFLGINRTDGRCLDIIDRNGRVTAGQLATDSGLTTGAVTAIVDRLERRGYVRRVRDESDRRKVFIENTEHVRQITGHVFAHFARLSPVLTSRFSLEQVRGILQFLEMGTYLSREMAAVLAHHTQPEGSGPDWRLESAAAFARAAEAETPRVTRDLEAIVRDFDGSSL